MKQNGHVNGYTGAIWTGQTTLQLAKTIEMAAKEKVTGLINAVPSMNISKYELLKLFNHYLRNDELTVIPTKGIAVNKTLICTNIKFDFGIPSYEAIVQDLATWMKRHKQLYPHYNL